MEVICRMTRKRFCFSLSQYILFCSNSKNMRKQKKSSAAISMQEQNKQGDMVWLKPVKPGDIEIRQHSQGFQCYLVNQTHFNGTPGYNSLIQSAICKHTPPTTACFSVHQLLQFTDTVKCKICCVILHVLCKRSETTT